MTPSSTSTARASRFDLGTNVDGVGMLVDEFANLVDVPFRDDAAVADEEDIRRHRLDFVQDMTRHENALPRSAPFLDLVE